jgi:hypothetical protein
MQIASLDHPFFANPSVQDHLDRPAYAVHCPGSKDEKKPEHKVPVSNTAQRKD